MTTYIALVRGINVGGNNLIKMADLRKAFAEMGLTAPKTLLQSGNVVFQDEGRSTYELEAFLEAECAQRLGVSALWFVRTATEWKGVIQRNPFSQEAISDPSHLLVASGKASFDPKEVEAVQGAIQGPEKIHASGKHLYMIYPGGIGKSKVDRTPGWGRLTKTSTARNWNTVLKLAELAKS